MARGLAEAERGIQVFENKCVTWLLRISENIEPTNLTKEDCNSYDTRNVSTVKRHKRPLWPLSTLYLSLISRQREKLRLEAKEAEFQQHARAGVSKHKPLDKQNSKVWFHAASISTKICHLSDLSMACQARRRPTQLKEI